MLNFTEQDLVEVLDYYDLGIYKSHRYFNSPNSDIYFLKTSSHNLVVKIPKDNDMKERELEYEFKITDYLTSKVVKVQTIYRKKDGSLLLKIKNRKLAVYSYVDGEHLPDKYTTNIYVDVAKNIGLMHKELLQLRIGDIGYSHRSINKFIQKGEQGYFTKEVKKDYHKLVQKIESINYDKLRTCVIRTDLTEINILHRNNKFAGFIDWSTAYKDYLVLDIAYYIANCIIKKIWIKQFFKEYNKSVVLNSEEKKALYYLIKAKLLQKEHLTKNSYPYFKKVTLEEFLNFGNSPKTIKNK